MPKFISDNKPTMSRIYNCGKQLVNLQAKPPGGDFFLHEQTIQLHPGKQVDIPTSYLNAFQIKNLQASRHIRILREN